MPYPKGDRMKEPRKEPKKRVALRHAVILGCLAIDVAMTSEKNGGLKEDHLDLILECTSSLLNEIGKALDMKDEVMAIYKEVREEMESFNALPQEYKELLAEHRDGFYGNA